MDLAVTPRTEHSVQQEGHEPFTIHDLARPVVACVDMGVERGSEWVSSGLIRARTDGRREEGRRG